MVGCLTCFLGKWQCLLCITVRKLLGPGGRKDPWEKGRTYSRDLQCPQLSGWSNTSEVSLAGPEAVCLEGTGAEGVPRMPPRHGGWGPGQGRAGKPRRRLWRWVPPPPPPDGDLHWAAGEGGDVAEACASKRCSPRPLPAPSPPLDCPCSLLTAFMLPPVHHNLVSKSSQILKTSHTQPSLHYLPMMAPPKQKDRFFPWPSRPLGPFSPFSLC